MKIITSDDKITVYTKNTCDDISSFVKKLIVKLKEKYKIRMHGFCQINVYKNIKVGLIIDILKEDDSYYFNDLIDIKINVFENSDIYISFDDYFWSDKKDFLFINNKYYIDVNDLSYEDFILATEFGKYEYGDNLTNIKKHTNNCI